MFSRLFGPMPDIDMNLQWTNNLYNIHHNMQAASLLEPRLAKTIAACGEYRQKMEQLFSNREGALSPTHMKRGIVINPRTLFNLLESNFLLALKSTSRQNYYQLKTEVLAFVSFLMEDFPLNAKFLYEEPALAVEGNRTLNLITYLIRDAKDSFLWMSQQVDSAEAKTLFQAYQAISAQIFYQVCSVCTLRTSQLKEITNNLTDFYYEQKLYTKLIGHCFRLLDAGLQERNITPYLYFLGNHPNDSVRVLYGNNRWHFAKGMTVFLWISTLRRTDCRLFLLSADDGSEIVIRLQGEQLVVQSGKGEKKERKAVGEVSIALNSPTMIGIELEPSTGTSFFKSSSFKLNIKIDGVQYLNIAPIPSFEKSQFIVQFSFLSNFIGKLYAAIVTARAQLSQYQQVARVSQYGVCRESLVWQFLSQEVLRTESILCIFNSQRSFQGLLLNYVGSMNHACFEGKVSEVKYHKYDSKVIDIYLPFVYMLTLIKDRDAEWKQLFDLLVQHLLQIIGRESYETNSIMLLLYFMELNNYEISQSTLNCLYYHANDHSNFYLNIVLKYLDVHALIQQGLKIDPNAPPFQDPVQKSILMFHLQTLWNEKWNAFQGFEGWWSPHFFSSQNDAAFDPQHFLYNPTRESRVEWSVINLVTKDSCKCLVQPVFLIPQYGQSSRYQQEYIRKECFNEFFRVNLSRIPKNEKLVCLKAAATSFDKIKSKLLGTADLLAPLKKEKLDVKQFASECLFVDILTVVQGQIMVDRSGFIIFTSAHRSRTFDHMCIKAFKNETFYYLNVPFCHVRKVYRKRFNASHNAVYIKTKDGREMMFHFYRKNAEAFLSVLEGHVKVKRDSINNYVTSKQPLLWIDKKLSNYEYLQWLNEIAGRNYNDITQYPVLPWVFVANALDSSHPYRDLTRNMGSHGDAERVQRFKEKYQQQNEEQLFSEYHFGTHYSSSAIIFNYLIRIRPYSVGALTLQSGHFDCADRIFYNYCGSWHNAITSPTDIRQLIPEIYTLPEMFINRNNYQYGLTQDKVPVDNVILPEWAKGNPFRFVARLRRELECSYVCEHIQQWVDLVYGYKQRGKEAVEHMNIFYPLTYENCIDLDKVKDPDERLSFQTQIAHFGQNPAQVIGSSPHPSRRAVKAQWQGKLLADGGEVTIQKLFLSKASLKQEKFLFKSVFEGRNSVLAVRFITQQLFLVLRKHEYHIFRILNKNDDFLSRQQTVSYELESCSTSINYKQLTTLVPVAAISDEILMIGGFYNGHVQILFLKQPKFNQSFKFPGNTVTGMDFEKAFSMLYLGDQEGYLRIYRVAVHQKQIQFQHLQSIKAHDSKINSVTAHYKANLLCTCSDDGTVSLYNLYSHQIIRTIHHPFRLPVHFARVSTTPLYAIVFYSRENSTIYVYSISGQYLDSIHDKTGFIYNPSILKGTDTTECLVYLNAHRQMFIWELPFLQLRRKVKVKRDDFRISCFETCLSGKIAMNGTEDGALQIIANPAAY